jgi:uncharacterized protein (TIGR01777 family)
MSDPSRVVAIAGANGMVGRHLVKALLARGERLIALVRSPERHAFPAGVDVRRWQARDLVAPVDGADAVANLVGDPIFAKRWSAARKQELIETRLLSTRSLVRGIVESGGRARTFVSSSAVEFSGDSGDRQVDETAEHGRGFLADLSGLWEAEARRASDAGTRVVLLRQSLVMGREGGVFAALLPLYRFGLGGTLGPGWQWFSWIHVDDAARLIAHALDEPRIDGPLISASPNPVTSREFARLFGQAVRRPRLAPLPRMMMRLLWGERGDLFLDSHRTVPAVALATGFRFRFPTLREAFVDLLGEAPLPASSGSQRASPLAQ